MSDTKYRDRGIKTCYGAKGLRLKNPRRCLVHRLRTSFLFLLRRWRNLCRNTLRLLRRHMVRSKRERDFMFGNRSVEIKNYVYDYPGAMRRSQLTHSNSFCSEAIADCLEFIKRNSVSGDDEMKPMLSDQK